MTNTEEFQIPEAEYTDTGLAEYDNNPLIKALPPLMDKISVAKCLRTLPPFNESEINLKAHIRAHAIYRLSTSFFQPLSSHIILEGKISIMIRQGYLGRNPNNASFNKHLNNGYERIIKKDLHAFVHEDVDSTASSFTLIGVSGCGKTTALNKILATYPRVIYHPKYHLIQIPWLKIDCPHAGSLSELCRSFFHALDRRLGTNYAKKYGSKRTSIDSLITEMAQLANTHQIGVLIIDEIQHLKVAKGGGAEKMLNFFVTLVNTIGVPVILVGTPKARPIFEGEFRQARRSAGQGSVLWDRMKPDQSWDKFVTELWKYQWLKDRQGLNQGLRDVIYDLTQGIMDILIKLMCLAQARALLLQKETLTSGLLKKVYDDELKPVHKMLNALRMGDDDRITEYSDLRMPDIEARLIQSFQVMSEQMPEEKNTIPEIHSDYPEKVAKIVSILGEMGIEADVAVPLVTQEVNRHPDLSAMLIIHQLTGALAGKSGVTEKPKSKPSKKQRIESWLALEPGDLRLAYANKETTPVYQALKERGVIYDVTAKLMAP
ncbi:MAG: ATP-binding protein [Pseudomonadales bacterium]